MKDNIKIAQSPSFCVVLDAVIEDVLIVEPITELGRVFIKNIFLYV